MSNKTIFPPIPFPAISREDLRILIDAVPYLMRDYKKDLAQVDSVMPYRDSTVQTATMAGFLLKYMPHHTSDTFREAVVPWLFECWEFWKKPAYVQAMEVKLAEVEVELNKHKDYIAWQKQHLVSPKFHQDTTIQVNDILHAMEQHGV